MPSSATNFVVSLLPKGVTAALFWRCWWPTFWRSATSLLSTLPSAAWTPSIGERQQADKKINTDAVTKNGKLILNPFEVFVVAVPYFDPRMVNGRGMSNSRSTTNDWLQICRASALKTQYQLTPYSTFSLISTINPEIYKKKSIVILYYSIYWKIYSCNIYVILCKIDYWCLHITDALKLSHPVMKI